MNIKKYFEGTEYTEKEFLRGKGYFENGDVKELNFENEVLSAKVADTSSEREVTINIKDNEVVSMTCSCEEARCKHMSAVLFAYNATLSGENGEYKNDGASEIILSTMHDEDFIYVFWNKGLNFINQIKIDNNTGNDIENAQLRIYSTPSFFEKYEKTVDIDANGQYFDDKIRIQVDSEYVANINEKVLARVHVELAETDQVIASEDFEIRVWPYSYMYMEPAQMQYLSSFVTPNHPEVTKVVQEASNLLTEWTGNGAWDAYQSIKEDPSRTRFMVAAIYETIRKRNINYIVHPFSADYFQRIRLIDQVISENNGTCLDMTLLFASCIEHIGLNPLLILIKGHIFAGVWLIDDHFSNICIEDNTLITKKTKEGIDEIVLVECTAMCSNRIGFEDAVKQASANMDNQFERGIDISCARRNGYLPVPSLVKTDSGYEVVHEEVAIEISEPERVERDFDFDELVNEEELTKQKQWEHKLLDLSTRNRLINLNIRNWHDKVVPLMIDSTENFEDLLFSGDEFTINPCPEDWFYEENWLTGSSDGKRYEQFIWYSSKLGGYKNYIAEDISKKKTYAFGFHEQELANTLSKMYKEAKESERENGISTMYLALGLMNIRTDKNTTISAPLVLIPVDLVKKPLGKGYSVKMREDDSHVNATLLEYLKQKYSLPFNGLIPEPMDANGLDIGKILAIFNHGIEKLSGWEINETAILGNFDFSQFAMWNDLNSNPEFFEKNDIVRSLINGNVDWNATDSEIIDENPYLTVSVDESQLRAINMAASNKSFVLHGPPGTGKSQTITGLISNALAKGKTVLFVAEKTAALDVVKNRLRELGIGDFCLCVDPSDSKKMTAVLDQFKRILEIKKTQETTSYEERKAKLLAAREEIDQYVIALHTKRKIGKSVRELIDEYENLAEDIQIISLSKEYVDELTKESFEKNIESLKNYLEASKVIGNPANHHFKPITQTVYNQENRFELNDLISEYRAAVRDLERNSNDFANVLGSAVPCSETEWNERVSLAECISESESVPDVLIKSGTLEEDFACMRAYIRRRVDNDNVYKDMSCRWKEDFFNSDISVYQKKYEEAQKKLFGKSKAIAEVISQIKANALFEYSDDKTTEYLQEINAYKAKFDKNVEENKAVKSELAELASKYSSEEELNAFIGDVSSKIECVSQNAAKIEEIKAKGSFEECKRSSEEFLTAYRNFGNTEKKLSDILNLVFDDSEKWLDERKDFSDSLIEYKDDIKEWIMFKAFEKECLDADPQIQTILKKFDGGSADILIDTYKKSVYERLIYSIISSETALNNFVGLMFNTNVISYKSLDEELSELAKKELYLKLCNNLPEVMESPEIGKQFNYLKRAISNRGRGISIRTLFDSIKDILPRMYPCMLMSPMFVSQYLSLDKDLFDIVVFDEASQVTTCKAVGCIARGKNAVIVGDEKQMPPTTFFVGDTFDDDLVEIEDLESILDDCLALGMPESYLEWHYRSAHESLIAYSNIRFYDSKMLTFPSSNDQEKKVKFVKVNGTFDSGKKRINIREADAIITEVKRRYNDPILREQSIGIVSFNIAQQKLIKDALEKELSKDSDMMRWMDEKGEIFVKNLENVQGDERDVILFSITFGPDADGKISKNFGPINKDGGWRRLNVAFTRAKKEMVIFSSMSYSDLLIDESNGNKGAIEVKNFLKYAETGQISHPDDTADIREKNDDNKSGGISAKICKELENAGYTYKFNVGQSKFKIDIAVINPFDENEYLLGILLDGESYAMAKYTRDREISQKDILCSKGWNVYRIWSLDWLDSRKKEIKRLLDKLEELKQEAEKRGANKPDEPIKDEDIIPVVEIEEKEKKKRGEKVVVSIQEPEFDPNKKARNLFNADVKKEE